MPVTLAPDDVVRTPAEAEANSREPLLVLEPLRSPAPRSSPRWRRESTR